MARRAAHGRTQPSLFDRLRSGWLYGTERLRQGLFIAMERLLSKRADRWVFATWPSRYAHTMDNVRAVFESIKDDPAVEKVILQKRMQDPDTVTAEGVNVRFVGAETLRGAYLLATAKVVLMGYSIKAISSYSRWLTTRHHIVQLWHGIPLKRIGKLFPGEREWDDETPLYAATVCSAPQDRAFMAAAFSPLPVERTWMTGLPRNCLLTMQEARLPIDYQRQLASLRARLTGRRLILYAPTWRSESSGMYEFSQAELTELRRLLASHDAVLGIRAHANRRRESGEDIDDGIIEVNDIPDVSVLLRETALLVTDYSSIYIDFLLAGRPTVFFPFDLDEYLAERGFLYEYEAAVSGPVCRSFQTLVSTMDAALQADYELPPAHDSARRLFHQHGSCPSRAVIENIRSLLES